MRADSWPLLAISSVSSGNGKRNSRTRGSIATAAVRQRSLCAASQRCTASAFHCRNCGSVTGSSRPIIARR
jgi:hypothetical protein